MSREDTKESRINTLKQTQETRKQDSLQRVYQAIERLQKIDAKVNFQTIAKEANVSVSYLYKYPELKSHIAQIRSKQSSMPITPVAKPNSSATGKIITKLRERISQLEAENSELKRKNEALAGQVYRVHYLTEQVERQQDTIQRLDALLKESSIQTIEPKVTPISQAKSIREQDEPQPNIKPSRDIESELQSLSIKLNSTLRRKIQSKPEFIIFNAIDAFKQAVENGTDIRSPGGWLLEAIDSEWEKNETLQHPQKFTSKPIDAPKNIDPNRELASPDDLKTISSLFEMSYE